jgi:RNA polymerase sigma-70 factor, ECF subfamily
MADNLPKDHDRVIGFTSKKALAELRRFLLRRVSSHVADDLMQEIQRRCLLARQAILGARDMRKYVFGIAANVVRGFIHGRVEERKRMLVGSDIVDKILAEEQVDEQSGPFEMVAREERRRLIQQALMRLKPRHAAVLYCVKAYELSYKETAERVGISEDQVDRYYQEAKGRMQVLLRRLERDFP